MAGRSPWAFYSEPAGDVNFNGGLNSAGGNLSLQDNESSGLQNVDFNFLGSVLKRNGYACLNTSALSGSPQSDGLWWYESNQSGTLTYSQLAVNGGHLYQMSGFSGTWNDITGSLSLTAGNYTSFKNFFNVAYGTNGTDVPFQVSNTTASTIPAFTANAYTFTVSGITTSPTNGATYTNNGVTYTVVGSNLNGSSGSIAGYLIATGSGVPSASGTLYKDYSFTVSGASVSPTAGTIYYNNSQLFTVISTSISGGNGTIFTTGSGLPASSGSLNKIYTFTVSGITTSPTVGATYTNNDFTFTVVSTSLSGTSGSISGTITAYGTGDSLSSGTLTKSSGTGDATVTFSLSTFGTGTPVITFSSNTYGTGDATISFTMYGVDTNITKAKYVEAYNNYVFMANVTVGSTYYPTRIYWSNLQDTTTWLTTSFIEIAMNDGQQITGMKVLGDNLIIFKTRSIYIVSFTGDPDIPFILQGGGRANSDVGCVAPFSIQEVTNGLIFLSYDGLYYFDGSNSTKMSDRINPTILGLNNTRYSQAVSMVQHNKHRYLLSVPSSSSSTNDTVITWDWYLNAFSIYTGINAASMCATFTSGFQEKLYFGDYSGYYYQMDTGTDDYPLGTQTAINAYYYTNWKSFGNILDEMAIPNVVLYYQTNNAVLTFAYSYDFNNADTYLQTLSTATSASTYGSGVYGTATYGGTGGAQQRIDLDGRGRVVRFKFANANIGETFRIDGLGELPAIETEA